MLCIDTVVNACKYMNPLKSIGRMLKEL